MNILVFIASPLVRFVHTGLSKGYAMNFSTKKLIANQSFVPWIKLEDVLMRRIQAAKRIIRGILCNAQAWNLKLDVETVLFNTKTQSHKGTLTISY
jgi:hypothetical protein